jgi:hypothetical protein
MNEWLSFYKKHLIEKIGERNIFIRYLGRDPEYKGNVTNPLRADKHPGCNFTISQKTGRTYFNDYAAEKSYDCFAIVMEKYGLSFWQAIRFIEKDFKVDLFSAPLIDKIAEVKPTKKTRIITYDIQDYTPEDLEYWAKYGITKELLKEYNILSLSNVYVNDRLRWKYSAGDPCFGLVYGPGCIKCYRPKCTDKKNRWLSNTKKEDIAFYYGLPFVGDSLIITKGFKDALVLNSIGFPAVAPSSETVSINTPKFRALKMTYDNVILLYDNDEVGIKSSERRSAELDIPYILIPDKYEVKDISDFREKYGEEKTIKLINKLIKPHLK